MKTVSMSFRARRPFGRRPLRCVAATLAAGALLAGATTASANWWRAPFVVESLELSNLYDWASGEPVNGAVTLIRDYNNDVVDIRLSTTALTPGHAYSIWIAAFNNPRYCSDECGVDDLPGPNPDADPRVRPSVFYGGGFLADGSGAAHVSLKVVPGRTNRELFGGTKGYGLQRLFATEIHVVVRTHGEPVLGAVADQIGSANLTCNTDTGMCSNVIFSVHPARD